MGKRDGVNVNTGDIVLYRPPQDVWPDAEYWLPAIVTVTHENWVPGYHDDEGNWVPTAAVVQPDKDHVHLTWFNPVAGPQNVVNVPRGEGAGCWRRR